jgi:hypothetical protein
MAPSIFGKFMVLYLLKEAEVLSSSSLTVKLSQLLHASLPKHRITTLFSQNVE